MSNIYIPDYIKIKLLDRLQVRISHSKNFTTVLDLLFRNDARRWSVTGCIDEVIFVFLFCSPLGQIMM